MFWSNRYRCCYMDLVVSSLSFFLFLNLLTLSWWIWKIQNYFLFEPISFASLTENTSTIFVAVLTLQLFQTSCWKAPRGTRSIRLCALAKWCAQLHKHISYFKAFSLQSSHKLSDESQKEAEKKQSLTCVSQPARKEISSQQDHVRIRLGSGVAIISFQNRSWYQFSLTAAVSCTMAAGENWPAHTRHIQVRMGAQL